MAKKTFYSVAEAAAKLGKTEEEVKALAREGTIREFRDAGAVTFKVNEIDALAATLPTSDLDASDDASATGSGSAEIILEPADDSSIELAAAGSDVLDLDELDTEAGEDTKAGTKPTKKKEDTAVPSVGINVFDDEELDEAVDPLAQTAVSDVAGLGMDGTGSGSGILDLTKESDDTSLGAELLDEIYTGEEKESDVEMGEDTRAGLDEAVPEEDAPQAEGEEAFEVTAEEEAEAPAGEPRAVVRQVVEYGPDAVSTGLTAGLIVAVVVMWIGGLAAAAMVRGIVPGLLEAVYSNLTIFAGGALVIAVIAGAVTYFLARRSS